MHNNLRFVQESVRLKNDDSIRLKNLLLVINKTWRVCDLLAELFGLDFASVSPKRFRLQIKVGQQNSGSPKTQCKIDVAIDDAIWRCDLRCNWRCDWRRDSRNDRPHDWWSLNEEKLRPFVDESVSLFISLKGPHVESEGLYRLMVGRKAGFLPELWWWPDPDCSLDIYEGKAILNSLQLHSSFLSL